MEIIGVICGIIGVGYLIYQFHFLPSQEIKEYQITLLANFYTSQKVIDKLIDNIKVYISQNGDEMYNSEMTLSNYVLYLEDMRQNELSENTAVSLGSPDLPKPALVEMLDSIKRQIHSLNQSQAYFDSRFKYK